MDGSYLLLISLDEFVCDGASLLSGVSILEFKIKEQFPYCRMVSSFIFVFAAHFRWTKQTTQNLV